MTMLGIAGHGPHRGVGRPAGPIGVSWSTFHRLEGRAHAVCRSVREARVHGHGGEQVRIAECQYRGHRATRGEPGNEHAPPIVHRELVSISSRTIAAIAAGYPASRCWCSGRNQFQHPCGLREHGGVPGAPVQHADKRGHHADEQATVSSSTPDPDSSNNGASASVTVPPGADLAIGKTGPMNPSGPETFTLAVSNKGPDDASDVVVDDSLPSQFTATSAIGPGFACTLPGGSGGTVVCTRGSLTVAHGAQPIIVTGALATGTGAEGQRGNGQLEHVQSQPV
jgi:Domain of unknown function DUF11